MNIKINFVAFVKVNIVTVQEIISLYKVHSPYLQRLSRGVLVLKMYREIQGTFTYICQSWFFNISLFRNDVFLNSNRWTGTSVGYLIFQSNGVINLNILQIFLFSVESNWIHLWFLQGISFITRGFTYRVFELRLLKYESFLLHQC
jgi:hypothetical protein